MVWQHADCLLCWPQKGQGDICVTAVAHDIWCPELAEARDITRMIAVPNVAGRQRAASFLCMGGFPKVGWQV